MKQLAVVLAAVLSLTLVAPALAQPFADVPTDHWAYDAIAELAAKGLIEGYPDGAFRGDRAMTRYEMAMVVARLLARIEAIKIPPLPPDLVRRADLDKAQAANAAALKALDSRLTAKLGTIQRLVAEFRAELAALGVRVTAVEEELAAIRARLDNTRVTGDMRYRYNVFPVGSPSGGGTGRNPDSRLRARVTLAGRVASNVEAVVRIFFGNVAGQSTAFDTRFGNNVFFNNVAFDMLYVDVRNTFGASLWRVGRQPFSLAPFGLGGGLLFDPANSAGAGSGAGYAPGVATTSSMIDGLRSDWAFGPLNVSVLLAQESITGVATIDPDGVGPLPPVPLPIPAPGLGGPPHRTFRAARLTTGALLPGWTLGGSYYHQDASAALNAPGALVGGTGWGLDISGTLLPGLRLYADWASWQARREPFATTVYPSATAWRVGGNVNLAQIAGIAMWNPNIDFAYQNFGPCPPGAAPGTCAAGWLPPKYSYATTVFNQAFDWNMRGWLARLNLTFSPSTSGFFHYESGTVQTSGAAYTEWWARVTHTLAPNTSIYAQYMSATTAGVPVSSFYRVELSTRW